jgi:hypothetical protein
LTWINTRPTTSKFIQGPEITMDERDADIFVDQAARCRRLAWNIADDAAKLKLTGHDDGGLAEEQQENWGAVERGERGSRSGPLATTVVCFRGCM